MGNLLVVESLADVKGRLTIYDLDGANTATVHLPTIGSMAGTSANPDDDSFYDGFTSFTYPTTVDRDELERGTPALVRRPTRKQFDADRYVVEQPFQERAAGTEGAHRPATRSRRRPTCSPSSFMTST